MAAVGVLIAIAGNYMNNIKPNYVAGIRLPWTLKDPDNWRRTHHLASKVWVLGGIALIISGLAVPERVLIPTIIAIIMVLMLVPGVYSYRIHRSKSNA